jgi:hypothetical protein
MYVREEGAEGRKREEVQEREHYTLRSFIIYALHNAMSYPHFTKYY